MSSSSNSHSSAKKGVVPVVGPHFGGNQCDVIHDHNHFDHLKYRRVDICKHRGIDCQSNENGNSLYMTCKDNGKSGTFPLTNDIPPHPIEDFCFRLCGA
ncbi:hypothetical protein P8452_40186 [Trifolium repens]|nr:hypothetical protein P8452_40186 [Trifolium repens]